MNSRMVKVISVILIFLFLLSSCATVNPNREIFIKSSNPDGKIFVNDEHIGLGSAVYTASEKDKSLDLRVSLPDFDDFKVIVEPEIVKTKDLLTKRGLEDSNITKWSGLVFMVLGGGTLYLISKTEVESPLFELYSYAVTGGGIGMFFGTILKTSKSQVVWPKEYVIDMTSLNHYDYEGFHKETGFSMFDHNRNGEFLNGDTFSGKIVDGNPTGTGVFFNSETGAKLIGSFDIGFLAGPGIKIFEDGQKVYAVFEKGLESDAAIIVNNEVQRRVLYKNGEIVEELGNTASVISKYPIMYLGKDVDSNGRANGAGTGMSEDGRIVFLNGEFRSGKLISGELYLPDGTVLAGSFSNDNLTEGDLYYSNGNRYSGSYRNGAPHGEGVMAFSNGDYYEGRFNNDVINGRGTYSFRDGSKYIGEFIDGIMSGIGSFLFNNGGSYKGEFLNGTFFGTGVLIQANGETFEGPFQDGLPHGEGIYKFENQIEKAEFYEGKRIDQAYIIRMDREAEKQAELVRQELERKRQEEEAKRIAEQKKIEEEARKKAESGSFVKGFVGGMTAGIVGKKLGLSDDAAIALAGSVAKDGYSSDSSLSNTISTVSTIVQSQNSGNSNKSSFANYQIKPQAPSVVSNTTNNTIRNSNFQNIQVDNNTNNQEITKEYTVNIQIEVNKDPGTDENSAINRAKRSAVAKIIKKMNEEGYRVADGFYVNRSMIYTDLSFNNIDAVFMENRVNGKWVVSLSASWAGSVEPTMGVRNDDVNVQSN